MAKKLPHIIIFNPDQWRGDTLGHIGNPAAITPNFDRLVREDGQFSECILSEYSLYPIAMQFYDRLVSTCQGTSYDAPHASP